MMSKVPYIIYLIGVLILVTPAFLARSTNLKVLFKNIALWGIIVLIIIFIYQIFIERRGQKINFTNIKGLLLDLEGVVYEGDKLIDGAVETLNLLLKNDRWTSNSPKIKEQNLTIYIDEDYKKIFRL